MILLLKKYFRVDGVVRFLMKGVKRKYIEREKGRGRRGICLVSITVADKTGGGTRGAAFLGETVGLLAFDDLIDFTSKVDLLQASE